jgi:hypothetical protein
MCASWQTACAAPWRWPRVRRSGGRSGRFADGTSEVEATDRTAALEGDDHLRAGVSLENMERKLLEMTLDATGGNRSRPLNCWA